MSFNIWGGGANEAKGIEETVAAIRAARCRYRGPAGNARRTRPLHGNRLCRDRARAWPRRSPRRWAGMSTTRRRRTGALGQCGDLAVSDRPGQRATISAYRSTWTAGRSGCSTSTSMTNPTSPISLLGIEYGPPPSSRPKPRRCRFATETPWPAMDLLPSDMAAADGAAAVFVTGDFNEPSVHRLDRGGRDRRAEPVAVNWPTTGGCPIGGLRRRLSRGASRSGGESRPSPGPRAMTRRRATITPTGSTSSSPGAKGWRSPMPPSWARTARAATSRSCPGRRTTGRWWPRSVLHWQRWLISPPYAAGASDRNHRAFAAEGASRLRGGKAGSRRSSRRPRRRQSPGPAPRRSSGRATGQGRRPRRSCRPRRRWT